MLGDSITHYWETTSSKVWQSFIGAIVAELRKQLPKTKILLLAIFPRHSFPENEMRRRNEEVNELISNLDYGDNIHYLNVNEVFLNEKLILQDTLMPDLLHPNESGYQRWAEAIEPTIRRLTE